MSLSFFVFFFFFNDTATTEIYPLSLHDALPILWLRRSWSAPLPKDKEPREILIVPELVPHIEAAMRASTNHLVFPRNDGSVFPPTTRWNLVDHLRRATVAAGYVAHYEH